MPERSVQEGSNKSAAALSPRPFFGTDSAIEYWVDAWQRSILSVGVLRQRGNNYFEGGASPTVPAIAF
jgi:hypothetical protein